MELLQIILQKNPEAALFDSRLNSAIVGVGKTGDGCFTAIYSKTAIIAALINSGVSAEDVSEYYHAYIDVLKSGKNAPIVMCDDITGG